MSQIVTLVTTRKSRNRESGVALFLVVFTLMLLSAIAASLIFISNTESSVDFNYRQEQVAYYAAKAGIEEVRARMMASDPASIASSLPTAAPSGTSGVVYLINAGAATGTVQPWTSGNAYVDDELCHDGYTMTGLQAQSSVAPNIRCTSTPSGSPTTVTSNIPWSGTAAALPYQWVRIAAKLNGSIQNHSVNPSLSATGLVCWTGTNTQAIASSETASSEEAVVSSGTCAANGYVPVYLITALGVSSTGARKMVQVEVALPVSQAFGFFATSTGCGALNISGGTSGIPVTDSYSSASGGTYATTHKDSGGNIGTNGNVNLSGGGTQVGGSIYAPNALTGSCPDGLSASGGSGMISGQTPPNALTSLSSPYTPATPSVPPAGSTTENLSSNTSLMVGNYGDITESGGKTLTLAPGTYDINSITLSGGSSLVISPPGAIVLNVSGTGGCCSSKPINFSGGSITNTSGIASNVEINYAGTGQVNLSGGSASYAVVDSPNAQIVFSGGSNFYGSVVGATINDSGGTALHYDTALSGGSTTFYAELSFRELPY